jgi:2-polyprenyl-6-hydroxyphenyl methylase/3-demethylubiquinone-9 3-methyltransferase
MTDTPVNADPAELRKFESIASRWWDPTSEFRPLHEINPLRLDYVDARASLQGKTVLDVGCGGGILAESMAARGAKVTGIDLGGANIEVARLHLLESGLEVDYREVAAEQLAEESPASFDVVTCMEMLEHVPDPASVITACARLVKPGGLVFLSTINRNPKAYLYAVVGAEYVLGMLPKGTHDYAKFIRPSELGTWLRAAGLELEDMTGLTYNPLTGVYALDRDDVSVNYMACARRPLDG